MRPSTARRVPAFWLALSGSCVSSDSTLLSAQGTGGRILGRVADPTGAVLAGVKVTLTNEATGVSRETADQRQRRLQFPEVPVGTYRLEFDLTGFKKNVRRRDPRSQPGRHPEYRPCRSAQAKEVVEVTSEAPLVDTTSTQLGAVVNDRTVAELPLNSRDTYQFLQLQPGVHVDSWVQQLVYLRQQQRGRGFGQRRPRTFQ